MRAIKKFVEKSHKHKHLREYSLGRIVKNRALAQNVRRTHLSHPSSNNKVNEIVAWKGPRGAPPAKKMRHERRRTAMHFPQAGRPAARPEAPPPLRGTQAHSKTE